MRRVVFSEKRTEMSGHTSAQVIEQSLTAQPQATAGKFIQIPIEIWRDKRISPDAKAVWIEIKSFYWHEDRPCFASEKTIANDINRSVRTVRYCLRELEKFGLVEVERRKAETNLYRPLLPGAGTPGTVCRIPPAAPAAKLYKARELNQTTTEQAPPGTPSQIVVVALRPSDLAERNPVNLPQIEVPQIEGTPLEDLHSPQTKAQERKLDLKVAPQAPLEKPVLQPDSPEPSTGAAPPPLTTTKPPAPLALVQALIGEGITGPAAVKLASQHPERIQPQIEALKHKQIKTNRPGLLYCAILQNWPLPEKLLKVQKKAQAKQAEAIATAEKAQATEEPAIATVDAKAWESLPTERQKEIEERAQVLALDDCEIFGVEAGGTIYRQRYEAYRIELIAKK